jgi:hypothetical protein
MREANRGLEQDLYCPVCKQIKDDRVPDGTISRIKKAQTELCLLLGCSISLWLPNLAIFN